MCFQILIRWGTPVFSNSRWKPSNFIQVDSPLLRRYWSWIEYYYGQDAHIYPGVFIKIASSYWKQLFSARTGGLAVGTLAEMRSTWDRELGGSLPTSEHCSVRISFLLAPPFLFGLSYQNEENINSASFYRSIEISDLLSIRIEQ